MFDEQGRPGTLADISCASGSLFVGAAGPRAIESRKVFTEKQISERIKGWHVFGDHALLRRGLIGWRLVQRTQDGSSIAASSRSCRRNCEH